MGIAHILQSMTPQRMLVTLVSSAINASSLTSSEPVYGTKYASSRVPDDKLEELQRAEPGETLHLPARNPFIPTQLEPLPVSDQNQTAAADPDEAYIEAPTAVEPESIALALRSSRQAQAEGSASTGSQSGGTSAAQALARFAAARVLADEPASLSPAAMEVWQKQDTVFRRPEQVVYALVSSEEVSKTAKHSMLTSLVLDAISDTLQTVAYQGARASYGYSVSQDPQASALMMTFRGFTQHMPLWIDTVLDGVTHPNITARRLDANLQTALIGIENAERAQQVYQRASYFARLALGSTRFSIPQRRAAANKLAAMTDKDLIKLLQQHANRIFAKVRLQLLVYGDVNAAVAAETGGIFAKALRDAEPLLPEEARALRQQLRKLSKGIWGVQRKVSRDNENDSAVFLVADMGLRLGDCTVDGSAGSGARHASQSSSGSASQRSTKAAGDSGRDA